MWLEQFLLKSTKQESFDKSWTFDTKLQFCVLFLYRSRFHLNSVAHEVQAKIVSFVRKNSNSHSKSNEIFSRKTCETKGRLDGANIFTSIYSNNAKFRTAKVFPFWYSWCQRLSIVCNLDTSEKSKDLQSTLLMCFPRLKYLPRNGGLGKVRAK